MTWWNPDGQLEGFKDGLQPFCATDQYLKFRSSRGWHSTWT
jgi:hypothetical protein